MLDTRENCWKFFIDRVRRQLKVVLCFSPVGSTLRVRARKFPAIINCTAINWFHEWPQEALISVSKRFLEELDVLPVSKTVVASAGHWVLIKQYCIDTIKCLHQFTQNQWMGSLSVEQEVRFSVRARFWCRHSREQISIFTSTETLETEEYELNLPPWLIALVNLLDVASK